MKAPFHSEHSGRAGALALAGGAAALLLYALTCSPAVQGGDAGELATVAAAGGVAHPPGYPLLTALGQLAVWLIPLGTPAWRVAQLVALQAACALALLLWALQALTRERGAALLAVVALGLSPPWWRYATVAEVFAGNALTAALLLAVSARVELGWRGLRPAVALGLVAATGVANHHSAVLLTPLGVYALWRSLPARTPAELARGALVSLGAALGGLVPYLWLLRPGGAWRWGALGDGGDLLAHLLRRDYGTFQLAAVDAGVALWQHPVVYATHLITELPLLVLLLLVGALSWRLQPRRGLALALLGSALLAGPLLLARFNTPVSGVGLEVAQRFYLLPDLLLAALAALGLAPLLDPARWRRPLLRRTALGLAVVLAALPGLRGRPGHLGNTIAEDYLRNSLAALPTGALVVGSSDSELGGYLYLQQVLGERRDLSFVAPPLLQRPWYRQWLAAQPGGPVLDSTDGSPAALAATLRQQRTLRPVYLALDHWNQPALRAALPPLVPRGAVLLELLPADAPPVDLAAVEAELQRARAGLTLRSWPGSARELTRSWEGDLFLNYGRAFAVLGELYRRAGDEPAQRRCEAQAARLAAPWTWPR